MLELLQESRRFIVRRLEYCFNEVKEILNSKNDDSETKSSFIFWMDNALEIVGIIEPDKDVEANVQKAKPAIEEVLCHAMSISQICTSEDSKAIKASIQSVKIFFFFFRTMYIFKNFFRFYMNLSS